MKTSEFTEAQIVFALRRAESGIPIAENIRKMEISEVTFYHGKKKHAGMRVAELRGRAGKGENADARKAFADKGGKILVGSSCQRRAPSPGSYGMRAFITGRIKRRGRRLFP